MDKIVLTNNKKVKETYADKADMRYMEGVSAHEIFEEAKKIVESGGKLLVDPSAGNVKSYYKSIVFMVGDEDIGISTQRSLELLDKCVQRTAGMKKDKEPVLAGIMQNKEVDVLKRILS